MRHQVNPDRASMERPLYPVRLLDDAGANLGEIIRFAGFPFCRTEAGEWALVDTAPANDGVDLD